MTGSPTPTGSPARRGASAALHHATTDWLSTYRLRTPVRLADRAVHRVSVTAELSSARLRVVASSHAASLVNVTGFIAGTTLYAMLLVMVLRPRSASQDARAGVDSLLVLTAVLGLAWNIEALISNGLRDFGVPALPRLAQALAFASLGLLPAVVVHSVLRTGLSRLTSPAALVQVVIAYAWADVRR